jgi:hypothetical protein
MNDPAVVAQHAFARDRRAILHDRFRQIAKFACDGATSSPLGLTITPELRSRVTEVIQ